MQMSFTYTFKKEYDEVICAYTLPYTYSQLMGHIKMLKNLISNYRKFNQTFNVTVVQPTKLCVLKVSEPA